MCNYTIAETPSPNIYPLFTFVPKNYHNKIHNLYIKFILYVLCYIYIFLNTRVSLEFYNLNNNNFQENAPNTSLI